MGPPEWEVSRRKRAKDSSSSSRRRTKREKYEKIEHRKYTEYKEEDKWGHQSHKPYQSKHHSRESIHSNHRQRKLRSVSSSWSSRSDSYKRTVRITHRRHFRRDSPSSSHNNYHHEKDKIHSSHKIHSSQHIENTRHEPYKNYQKEYEHHNESHQRQYDKPKPPYNESNKRNHGNVKPIEINNAEGKQQVKYPLPKEPSKYTPTTENLVTKKSIEGKIMEIEKQIEIKKEPIEVNWLPPPKEKISPVILAVQKAREELTVRPPKTTFLLADTYKNMSELPLEPRWVNYLREDMDEYEKMKSEIFQSMEEGSSTEGCWVWVKEHNSGEEIEIRTLMEEFQKMKFNLNDLYRKLKALD